mmetsp:Transcript_18884/g.29622  ORF Transcript_18884/g.29622 Transcript_18884/m.29622 type:complete len:203 (+) Transcript_18884:288-896(+)
MRIATATAIAVARPQGRDTRTSAGTVRRKFPSGDCDGPSTISRGRTYPSGSRRSCTTRSAGAIWGSFCMPTDATLSSCSRISSCLGSYTISSSRCIFRRLGRRSSSPSSRMGKSFIPSKSTLGAGLPWFELPVPPQSFYGELSRISSLCCFRLARFASLMISARPCMDVERESCSETRDSAHGALGGVLVSSARRRVARTAA